MSSNFPTIGNYRLLEELASGAFGRVHRAEHIYLSNRIVAVKLLHAHLSSEKERESFLREARILEMLKHPHILPILDVGIHEGTPYMITEFASHGSLRQRLSRQGLQLLPLEDTMRILTQVAEALQTAHQQQIVHRDLKPENILFHANGNALLADFGISTALNSMSVQQATITGTPPYMAPEQFKGNVSKRSDQYALGCIAYELVTGHRPFTAPDFWSTAIKHMTEPPLPPTQFNPRLPEHVSQAILKTLAKEHHERYADIVSFIEALTTDLTSPVVYIKKGIALHDLKHYEEALAAFDQALSFDPQYVDAYNGKGNALYELKRYKEALAVYDQALQLDPRLVDSEWKARSSRAAIDKALNRFRSAVQGKEMFTIVKAYDPSLKEYLRPQEHELLELSRKFVAAYQAGDDAALANVYDTITRSPYHKQLGYTPTQHERIKLARNRMSSASQPTALIVAPNEHAQQIPAPPPQLLPQETPASKEHFIAKVKGQFITLEWFKQVLQLKEPYTQDRIRDLRRTIKRLEEAHPDPATRHANKFMGSKLKELEKLLKDLERLREATLDNLVNDVLIREEIDKLTRQDPANRQRWFDIEADLLGILDRLRFEQGRIYSFLISDDRNKLLEILRIFRRHELLAIYLLWNNQGPLQDWLKEQRNHEKAEIAINYNLAGVKPPTAVESIWCELDNQASMTVLSRQNFEYGAKSR